jgi:hypothetical protein
VLAFYLPQFHPVAENDAWLGPGFTEWSMVARSRPLFPGHRQPDLPGELGFYDLRVPETRYLQARLAREHGITGFLYYHYWFAGRRMLGRPLDEVRASGEPDFPFALCWCNESWYRRWQGVTDEMLLEQTFSEEDDVAHIRWLIECFEDPRYIRIEGRPLLAIYRAQYLPDPARTVALWQRECAAAGVEPPWLVLFETSGAADLDPRSIGFDASAEFVPHLLVDLVGPSGSVDIDGHTTFEYEAAAAAYLNRAEPAWRRYGCVATGWDNAPRRQDGHAFVLRNSTPSGYGHWLRGALERQAAGEGQGVVFVNAWNEWAEGAHLEPDAYWGRAYLEETRAVLDDLFPDAARAAVPEPAPAEPTPLGDLYYSTYEELVQVQRWSSGLVAHYQRRIDELKNACADQVEAARADAFRIAELNELMAQALGRQAARLRQLGDTDPEASDWLVG